MKKNISDIKNCVGCGACLLRCPKSAISISYNKLGQAYPEIAKELCVDCGLCREVCSENAELNKNISYSNKKAYIAFDKNSKSLQRSSSGGIATVLAREWILQGGIVCGASGVSPSGKNDEFTVKHILVEKIEDLITIQGSKYVQSSVLEVLPVIKKLLGNGKKVLFFGTSCQVNALISFVGETQENLLTCDLICHGVMGNEMFKKYINYIERKERKRIIDVSFRIKDIGLPPCTFTCTFIDSKGSKSRKTIEKNKSSYYRMFLGCIGYRNSCYHCRYATVNKPADITLGDYYEAKDDYPELFKSGRFNMERGVSSVIVHTDGGEQLYLSCKKKMESQQISVEKVVHSHTQLNKPSAAKKGSQIILIIYKLFGWRGVNGFYYCFDKIKMFLKKF